MSPGIVGLVRLAAVVIVTLLLPEIAIASRFKMSATTVTTRITLENPSDIISFKSVTFSTGGLVLDVGSMASTTGFNLQILLCDCSFTNGAVLYVIGGSSSGLRSMKLVFQSLAVSSGGAIVFSGTMPHNSVISFLKLTVNSNTATLFSSSPAAVSIPSDAKSSYVVSILLSSLTLTSTSSLVFKNAKFGGLSNAIPLYIFGNVVVDTYSVLQLLTWTINIYTGIYAPGRLAVASNSLFEMNDVYFNPTCTMISCFYFGNFVISSTSVFALYSVSGYSSINNALHIIGSLSSSSLLVIRGSILRTDISGTLNSVEGTLTVGSSCSFVIINSAFSANPFGLSVSGSGAIYGMCNTASGATTLGGIYAGLSTSLPFTKSVCTSCQALQGECFTPLTSYLDTNNCNCHCTAQGHGSWCFPTEPPAVKANCIQTESSTPSGSIQTVTQFISDQATSSESTSLLVSQTNALITLTNTVSVSSTAAQSKSRSYSLTPDLPSKSTSGSVTTTDTMELTMTWSMTITNTMSFSAQQMSRSSTVSLSSHSLSPSHSSSTEYSATPTTNESSSETPTEVTSDTKTNSKSISLSESRGTPTHSAQRSKSNSFSLSISPSPTVEWSMSLSVSQSCEASNTASDESSVTDSLSDSGSETVSVTVTRTVSPGPTFTRIDSRTRTFVITESNSSELSESVSGSWSSTLSATASNSSSPSFTPTQTRSKSESDTLSWCFWSDPLVNTTPPLVETAKNFSMVIDYYSYSRSGCMFWLPDLGQWYLKNYSYSGVPAFVSISPQPITYNINFTIGAPTHLYHPQIEKVIVIDVTFRCAVVNNTMLYVITVPASYAIARYDAEAMAMRATALISFSTMSTTTPGFFADTSVTLGVLMMCRDPSEVTEFSLAPIAIGDGPSSRVRGAVIMNIFVFGLGSVALAGVALLIVTLRNSTLLLSDDDKLYLYPPKKRLVLRRKPLAAAAVTGEVTTVQGDAATSAQANDSDAYDLKHVMAKAIEAFGDSNIEPPILMIAEAPDDEQGAHPSTEAAASVVTVDDKVAIINDPPLAAEEKRISPSREPTEAKQVAPESSRPESKLRSKLKEEGTIDEAAQDSTAFSPRFFLEWSRTRTLTAFPLCVAHPAMCATVQLTVGAGVALYRMQASRADNALGTFAVLCYLGYTVYVTVICRKLYYQIFYGVSLRDRIPEWYWQEVMGAEMRRRAGIYLVKPKLRRKKKRRRKKKPPPKDDSGKDKGDEFANAQDLFDKAESTTDATSKKPEAEKEKDGDVWKVPSKLSMSDSIIFSGISLPWYAPFRLVVSLIFGAAAGTPPIQPDVCDLQIWVVILVTVVHLGVLVYFQPLVDPFELGLSIANCCCVICMAGCLAVATRSSEHQKIAVDGASVCLFLILSFALLQVLYHAYSSRKRMLDVFRALIRGETVPPLPPPPPPPPAPIVSSSSSESFEIVEESEESEEEVEEEMFVLRDLQETELVRREERTPNEWDDLKRLYTGPSETDTDNEDFFAMIATSIDPLSRRSVSPPPPPPGGDDDDEEDEEDEIEEQSESDL